jgi:steroid 5-alpha reductase family enzyme
MQDVIVSLAIGAILVAAVAALWALALFVRQKAQVDERWQVVNFFVAAAEQMMRDADGEEKLEWVLEQLQQRYPKLDRTLIRAMVEAAVRQLDR